MFNVFSANVISLVMLGASVIAVFNYVPVVSEFAFWIALGAYLLLWYPSIK